MRGVETATRQALFSETALENFHGSRGTRHDTEAAFVDRRQGEALA